MIGTIVIDSDLIDDLKVVEFFKPMSYEYVGSETHVTGWCEEFEVEYIEGNKPLFNLILLDDNEYELWLIKDTVK